MVIILAHIFAIFILYLLCVSSVATMLQVRLYPLEIVYLFYLWLESIKHINLPTRARHKASICIQHILQAPHKAATLYKRPTHTRTNTHTQATLTRS